jgi:GDP-4-dehydro-6-deoxy-D-mannose reductase
MNFLITGIKGFNGPHLARELIAKGHSVTGMSHQRVDGDDGIFGQIDLVSGDLRDQLEIDDIFRSKKYDGVFHLGSRTHPPTSFQHPVDYFETNALGAVYITEAIRKFQPDTVLMNCSTCEVYGIHPEGTYISEKTPTLASNPYSVSKLAADIYIQERCTNGLLKAFITRSFSHTGPGRPSNYSISSDAIQIARIIKGIQEPVIKVGNLSCKRVVVDVRDIVAVYARLMDWYMDAEGHGVSYGEVYNIGGDNLHTIGHYLNLMLSIFGLNGIKLEIDERLYRKFDIPVQYPDSTKIRKMDAWHPKYNINETLKDLVEYWLERV